MASNMKSFNNAKEGFFSLNGRILKKRSFGNLIFLTLKNQDQEIQISLQKKVLGDKFKELSKNKVGDLIKVEGELYYTKTNTKTLSVSSGNVLTSCSTYLPDKFKGITKGFARKNRGVDLLTSSESTAIFMRRNQIISQVRKFLFNNNYQEVDTGILQNVSNTSPSSDFVTFSNYFNKDLFLRKTPELRLKQLLVGGLENIFELGKNFRNEGVSKMYHPEYTILELYKNNVDYRDVLNLTIDILETLNEKIYKPISNPTKIVHVDLYDFIDSEKNSDVRGMPISKLKKLIDPEILKNYGSDEEAHRGFYIYDIFRSVLKNHSDENIVLHGVPKEISVLGKTYDDEPTLVEEFRYFVKGNLICNGITELTDYDEQKRRIEKQARTLGKSLDVNDNQFLDLLKLGLPPCAGIGLGVEKLLMVYLEKEDVRDVIYYPL